MSTPDDIKRAIVNLIVRQALPSIPQTTLTAPISAGGSLFPVLTVAPLLDAHNRPRIRPGGYLGFYDATGESMIPVQDVSADATTITLNCTGLEDDAGVLLAGLQYSHTAGTTVYSNVGDFIGWTVASMCELGDPAISVTVREWHARQDGFGFGFPPYVAYLQYNRLYERPGELKSMDANLWARQQERKTWRDIEAIGLMLLKNQQLITDFTPAVAEKFAPIGSNKDLLVATVDWQPVEGQVWHHVGKLTMVVTAAAQSYR